MCSAALLMVWLKNNFSSFYFTQKPNNWQLVYQCFSVLWSTATTKVVYWWDNKKNKTEFPQDFPEVWDWVSMKLIHKMQQNIGNLSWELQGHMKDKTSPGTILTPLYKQINKAEACLAQDLRTYSQNTFVTNVIKLYVWSILFLNVRNFSGVKKKNTVKSLYVQ